MGSSPAHLPQAWAQGLAHGRHTIARTFTGESSVPDLPSRHILTTWGLVTPVPHAGEAAGSTLTSGVVGGSRRLTVSHLAARTAAAANLAPGQGPVCSDFADSCLSPKQSPRKASARPGSDVPAVMAVESQESPRHCSCTKPQIFAENPFRELWAL